MRQSSQHILFLATEFDAPGMRPYARNIINAMWQTGDHVLIVSRYETDNLAFPMIPSIAITWINYPCNKLAKALFRYWPSSVLKAIKQIIDDAGIKLIYSLTGELVLAPHIKRLQQKSTMLYTVHDAVYHDYKFNTPWAWLKDRLIIAWPQQRLFKHTLHKVTNSREQLRHITKNYCQKTVQFAPFPTLVNDDISRGGMAVEELQGITDGYILFFGTLQLYKGVHLLHDTYLAHPEFHSRPLVIAGSGDIYFEHGSKEKGNIVFINRYIDDRELMDLFSRAAVVVYPYTSATQSGVTSIASYFGKPMVLSDLPFFTETCQGYEGVEFFKHNDINSLAVALRHRLQSHATTRDLYRQVYAPQAMREAINDIISSIIKSEP